MSRSITHGLGTLGLGLGVLLVLAPGASPAFAQSKREMQMMADVRMLQEQTQQLQQQLTAAIEQLSATLKTINARVDDQAAATRKSFADQKLAVDQFGSDLRVVRERIDENTVRISSLSQEVEALRLAIPQMSQPGPAPADPGAVPGSSTAPTATAPPSTPPVVLPSTAPTATAPPSTPPVVLAPGMTPQRMYNTSLADFTAGQWVLCIEGFGQYLATFPRTDLSDDAQWYVGECYQQDGKFAEAVDAYNRVITNYPKGDRVPDAYYKRGVALSAMGQTDRARESFETLMKNFPDHDMARMAKQQLDRLNRGKPRG